MPAALDCLFHLTQRSRAGLMNYAGGSASTSPEQKARWLTPLLEGKIRSCFAMTEPEVASSDATNIQSRIVREGDSYVLNGHKWWTSGAGETSHEASCHCVRLDGSDSQHGRAESLLCTRHCGFAPRIHSCPFHELGLSALCDGSNHYGDHADDRSIRAHQRHTLQTAAASARDLFATYLSSSCSATAFDVAA